MVGTETSAAKAIRVSLLVLKNIPVRNLPDNLEIAVIGSGISGLSAAWLLSKRHKVTLFEADDRIGGHSNTVQAGAVGVDTGFIVYNEETYPNLTALFRHLGVRTKPSKMSFAVSVDDGRLEYSGSGLTGLFAQPGNALRPRFWGMLLELLRFYREAAVDAPAIGDLSLTEYLDIKGYGGAFKENHLLPMAAAIWSTPIAGVGSYPASAFIRFCLNHGLLRIRGRPIWRTVEGGSREYVRLLLENTRCRLLAGTPVRSITGGGGAVQIIDERGSRRTFDHVVIAAHADQALRMIHNPSPDQERLLGAFSYVRNEAILHSDAALMPRRKKVWSSWNYMSRKSNGKTHLSVTYWMNSLQGIARDTPLFVTLNPMSRPRPETVLRREVYEHPVFDCAAMAAQRELWSLQGERNIWFCGSYFGWGFHEDGLQAGLAVAEQLGGAKRPWAVSGELDRIFLSPPPMDVGNAVAA